MDLACGDKEQNVFAGLLVRAVIDSSDKLIEGPCLVVDKILELNGHLPPSQYRFHISVQDKKDSTMGLVYSRKCIYRILCFLFNHCLFHFSFLASACREFGLSCKAKNPLLPLQQGEVSRTHSK